MLGQIELAQSVPTVTVLWKIATALEVPFSALISASGARGATVVRRADARTVASEDGLFASRALFPFDQSRGTEFYELTLAPSGVEVAQAHAVGTMENLVVAAGTAEIEVNRERVELGTGDSLTFHADQPHAYRNPSSTVGAVLYLVMTYAST